MPQPWLIGVKKRSVEKDYRYYDPPKRVYDKITSTTWEYKGSTEQQSFYHTRDLALMCILYISTARVSEIVRATVKGGNSPSITKQQFVTIDENYLMLRNVPVHKRMNVETLEDYPKRIEIPFPLKGGLSLFTEHVQEYLQLIDSEEELFKFGRERAWQIINHITGEFPHYLRDMGLKMWLRIFERDIVTLKYFSSHQRLDNLAKYLQSTWIESSKEILRMKL